MTSARLSETPAMSSTPADLEGFYGHVRYSNPFEINRVVQAFTEAGDVAPVHDRPFQQLRELADRSHRQHPGIGAVLWGDPGIGKSHLLARLSCWAGRDNQRAIFVYLANLQANPETLPRSLLRCVISILIDGQANRLHLTPLYRLVLAAIQRALRANGSRRYSEAEALAAYHQLIDELSRQDPSRAAVTDRNIFAVFFRFWRSAFGVWKGQPDDGLASLALRWLSGEPLDADEARRLELPRRSQRDDVVCLADKQEIKNVLVGLIQLASWWRRPVILCFDQVDNLDEEQFTALARFLHALIDATGNLLVITSGVQPTLLRWKADKVIQDSSWDRLAQYEVELQPVSAAEARQIIQARLQPFQETFRPVEPVWRLVQKDMLFPLGERWAQSVLGSKLDLRPRDVINLAREGWRREQTALSQQGGPAWLASWPHSPLPVQTPATVPAEKLIDEAVARKLHEHTQQKLLEPQTLPPDADNLVGLLHTLLHRCLNAPPFPALRAVERQKTPKYGQQPPYQLVLRQGTAENQEARTGVLCLAVSDRKSMAAFLRRLVDDTRQPDRLVIVVDERRPLDPAASGKDYLEKLRTRHQDRFHQVDLSLAAYAELDALQAVVGLARSGDLELQFPGGLIRPVKEEEVVQSHFRQQRFLAHSLLKLLLTGEGPAASANQPHASDKAEPDGELDEQDLRQFIMGRLAITMGISSHELAVHYQSYLKTTRNSDLTLSVCKRRLEATARALHQEGKVNATPHDDYLYLLLK